MSVCLAMIVKNEELVIPRLIDSVKDHIDSWYIIDTGSTDHTVEVIHELLKDIPGELTYSQWKSFGENRTELIKLAPKEADYLLIADADEEFFIEPGAFDNLTEDGYQIKVSEGAIEYRMPLLVSTKIDWYYQGLTHEYLTADWPHCYKNKDDVTAKHWHDGGCRSDKYERDLELLRRSYEENPNDSRTIFYLAQTMEGLNFTPQDIADRYIECALKSTWDEEIYECYRRAGKASNDLQLLLKAWEGRPERLEALYEACWRLRAAGLYQTAYFISQGPAYLSEPPDDILFVEPWIWQYGIKFEHSQAALKIEDYQTWENLSILLLQDEDLPQSYRHFITQQLELNSINLSRKV